mmetsp:Transcript_60113/g.140048  ORF Transcript_60113/g.140048 Transcript_60113/m.140048 type:complete len:240 (+) Transcript_60113:74-793(+)
MGAQMHGRALLLMVRIFASLASGTSLGAFELDGSSLGELRLKLLEAAGCDPDDHHADLLVGNADLRGDENMSLEDALVYVGRDSTQPVTLLVLLSLTKLALSRRWALGLPQVRVPDFGWGHIYKGRWRREDQERVGVLELLALSGCPEEVVGDLLGSMIRDTDIEFYDGCLYKSMVVRQVPGTVRHVVPCYALVALSVDNPSLRHGPNPLGVLMVIGKECNLQTTQPLDSGCLPSIFID